MWEHLLAVVLNETHRETHINHRLSIALNETDRETHINHRLRTIHMYNDHHVTHNYLSWFWHFRVLDDYHNNDRCTFGA